MLTPAMRLAEAEGVKHASGVHHPKMGTFREGLGLPTNPSLSPVTRDYPRGFRQWAASCEATPAQTLRSFKEPWTQYRIGGNFSQGMGAKNFRRSTICARLGGKMGMPGE
jgi:hypothetical protein